MRWSILVFLTCCLGATSWAVGCTGKTGTQDGQCAPEFELVSTDGKSFKLSDYKGKVVVVNFWATWCEPCIEELPSLNNLFQKKIPGLELVSVSIDKNQKALDRFFARNKNVKVSFPILQDFDKKVSSLWGTYKVPETFIIDPSGRIIHKEIGIRPWDEELTIKFLKLLGNK